MFEEIKKAIDEATIERAKTEMIHYQVLIHAKVLTNVDPLEFCNAVGIKPSYAEEFVKMIKLGLYIIESGGAVTPFKPETINSLRNF